VSRKHIANKSVIMTNVALKIIKPKLGLLELAKELGNVSKACSYSC